MQQQTTDDSQLVTLRAPVNPDPLADLEQTIRAHWSEARPGMVARLAERGLLDACVKDAVELTRNAMLEMIDDGAHPLAAWEAVRGWAAILPTEEDDPNLDGGLEMEDEAGVELDFTFAEIEGWARETEDDLDV